MATPKISTPIIAPTIGELSHIVASLATAKTPMAYLQLACKSLGRIVSAPVTGFALNKIDNYSLVAEQSLAPNLRGLVEYPSIPDGQKNPKAWTDSAPYLRVTRALGITDSKIKPLTKQDEQIGGLVIWSSDTSYSQSVEEALNLFINHVAAGLQALLLEQSSKNRLAEAITLQHITQTITGSLDFDKVSTTLLQNARKFFRVEAVALALTTPDGREFYVDQAIGLSPEYISKLRMRTDTPIAKRMLSADGPIQLDHLETAPISGDVELATREGVKSCLLMPIFSGGKLVGGLGLISKTPRVFTYAELRFGQSLAEHAGIAFANANLHTSLRKASNEIEQTRNLMRDGLLVFDLNRQLNYFNAAAGTILQLNHDQLHAPFRLRSIKEIAGLKINPTELLEAIDKALQGHVSRTKFSVENDDTRYYEAIYSPYRDTKGNRIGALMNIRDITSLYLEKEKLQAIQNGISDGLILIGPDGSTIECNQEWQRLFDLHADTLPSPFFTILAGRKNFSCDQDPLEVISSAIQGKRTTFYAHDLDNSRHIQITINPILVSGHISGAVATARDITALIDKTVEANEMAAKAHRHLRELSQLAELSGIVGFNVASIYQKYLSKTAALLESTSVSLYLYNPTRQILVRDQATNPRPQDLPTLDLNSKHLAAKAFTARGIVTADTQSPLLHSIALPITHHSKTLGALFVSRPSIKYGEHEAKLLKLVATRLAVLVENSSLYHDVNARRERWEAVFRFTEEGIVIFDSSGTIVGFNPASTEITQYQTAEAIGKPFSKIIKTVVPEAISAASVTPIARVLEEGVTITKSEQRIETRSGGRVWTEISYSPIFDDTGRVTSGIAIIRNISKDREVEEIKSDFISIVSHELRTPLTAIKGFLSMTLKHDFGPLSEKQYHYLSRVYQSNQRMIDLVEDLMDATYIESGKISLNIAPVALDAVAASVVSEVAAKGAAGQIMINIRRRQRLPLVLADETRLHQIVLNLVDNAIKYSHPGTEVQISFRVAADELITTVTDHGVGIGKSQIERLFTKFGRIFNPLSVQAGGTGLGLYIVKNLVESHEGRIWVTSIESKGSKFNFSLPIAKQLPLIE